jgi:tetratricopeptide (TPR) repeat protein
MQSFLLPLSAWLWRGLSLLWLALAPYAAKVEVAPARSTGEAVLYLAAALVLLAGFAYGVRRLAVKSRVGAALAVFALLAACVLGSVFRGERAPLGRALLWIFPAVWAAVAFNLAGPLADVAARSRGRSVAQARERAGWAIAALAFGLLGLAASYRSVGSADALLRAAVQSDPGNEILALRLARQQQRGGDERAAEATDSECILANPDACGCALPLLASTLERGAYEEAGAVFVRAAPRCRELPGAGGMLAEALAGGGEAMAARRAAESALAKDPHDARALYAKALLAVRDSDSTLARQLLEQALAAGRGGRARVELGSLLFKLGDFAGARALFEAALRDNPQDLFALYDLALVDQTQNHYHAAREGYLKLLRLDPHHLDARYNLAVLTNSVGAHAEAEHHVAEFEKLAPAGDARVAALKELVQ